MLCYVVALTGPRATHGRLNPIELLTVVAAVPLAVGLGAAAGRWIPVRLAPIVAAIAPYGLYISFEYADVYLNQTAFSDLVLADQTDRDYLRLPVELLVARPVFWTAAGLGLAGWALLAHRAAYALTVAAGIGAAVALPTAGVRITVPDAYAVTCLDGRPVVCVDRAHDHMAQAYQDLVAVDVAAIPGFDVSNVTVAQSETLFQASREQAGTAPVVPSALLVIPIVKGNTSPAHEIDRRSFHAHLGQAVFLAPCTTLASAGPQSSGDDGRQAGVILYAWWLASQGLPSDGSNFPGELSVDSVLADDPALRAAAQRFEELTDAQRAAWVAENQDAILSCRAELR